MGRNTGSREVRCRSLTPGKWHQSTQSIKDKRCCVEGKASQRGGCNSNLDITGRAQQTIHDDALMSAGKITGLAGGEEQPPWDTAPWSCSRGLGLKASARCRRTCLTFLTRSTEGRFCLITLLLLRGIKQGVETRKLLLPLVRAKHV